MLRLLWVWFVFPLDPVPGNLYISYPITWAITGAVHIIMFLAIRKKAYAKVQGSGPSHICLWMDTIRKRRSSEKKKRLGSLRGDLSRFCLFKKKKSTNRKLFWRHDRLN